MYKFGRKFIQSPKKKKRMFDIPEYYKLHYTNYALIILYFINNSDI